jgi:hypothetical protein
MWLRMKILLNEITETQNSFSTNSGGKLRVILDEGPGTNELKQSYCLKA